MIMWLFRFKRAAEPVRTHIKRDCGKLRNDRNRDHRRYADIIQRTHEPASQEPERSEGALEYAVTCGPACLCTIVVTAAFNMDSCAPMPMPQRAIPMSTAGMESNANMRMANGAETSVDHTSARTPFLSYITPKKSAATASTSIAPA